MPASKGHLNPGAPGVSLERLTLAPELAELVRHVWIARWDLAPGEVSVQRVLTYPAFNVVISPMGAMLFGPNPRAQTRELSGRSWVVGVLLRPAAARLLSAVPPVELVGLSCALPEAPRVEPEPRDRLVDVLTAWLRPFAERIDERGRTVNAVCRLAEEDTSLVRVRDLADRVELSTRSLERLVVQQVGVKPKWLIECRRLQEAATTMHAAPRTELTQLALHLGYVDQAHFTKRYKEVIGETPDQTRRRALGEPSRSGG